jgi:hypothetical protein
MQHLLGAFPRIRAGIDVGVCRPVHEIESTDSAESRWGSLRRFPPVNLLDGVLEPADWG